MLLKSILPVIFTGIKVSNAFQKVDPALVWYTLNPGWNLGNTLDAVPTEGSWNNPPVLAQTFSDIKSEGFKSVRIPVTWTHHFSTEAPDYTVDATWMSRVETVVDFALGRGFWVVLNVHHDSWEWADLTKPDPTQVPKFEKLWTQIAARFKNKSEKLIFESLNEPAGSPDDKATADLYNDLNKRFLSIVRNSGGFNKDRVVSLPSLHTNIELGNLYFERPAATDNWTYQVHYYTPWDFISNWWGRTFWGSEADKAVMLNDLKTLAGNFTVPKLIGEFGTSGSGKIVEKAAAWLWFDYFVRTARSYGIAVQVWDNGNDFFDRAARKWRDPTIKDIIIAAAAGKVNTLPENGNATVWIRDGEPVTDKNVYLQFNGNSLSRVTTVTGTSLTSSQYAGFSNGVTIKAAYLKSLLAANPGYGTIGTIIIRSSQGVDLPIEIKKYSTPTITTTSYTAPPTSSELSIPVTLNGARLATVKAVKADGIFLKDDWTIWLGEPQAGRINWGDFDYDEANRLIVSSSLLSTIQSSGQAVTLTWEFWPRYDGANKVDVVIDY